MVGMATVTTQDCERKGCDGNKEIKVENHIIYSELKPTDYCNTDRRDFLSISGKKKKQAEVEMSKSPMTSHTSSFTDTKDRKA